MQAVTNQLSYEPINPIPIPSEGWPKLAKLFSKTVLAVAIVGVATTLGVTLGLAELGISVIDGAILGGMIGLICSIFAAIFVPITSRLSQYRLDTLKQIEGVMVATQKVESAFKALKYFLTYPLESFSQTYQNNALHDALTTITTRVSPERPDAKKVWKAFLENLHKSKVVNADGATIELDFSIELARLEGKEAPVAIESLKSWWSDPSDEELLQIEEIQKVCFGKVGTLSPAQLDEYLKDPESGCFVARDQESKKILGFAMYVKREEAVVLSGLAHVPGAAGRGIGGDLMQAVIDALPKGQTLQLQVRKSNPAVHFYKKWFFEEVKALPNYYSEGPAEDGILMEFKPEKYQQELSAATAA